MAGVSTDPRRDVGHEVGRDPGREVGPDPRRAVGPSPRRDLGQLGEQLASEHLERRGFTIVERNYRTRWGELDVIAFDGTTLAFCEVKTRRAGGRAGAPFESLGRGKQAQVRRMAARWLVERRDRPHADQIRFDAIGVTFDGAWRLVALEHLENAF
ncbi:MAG: putative endonuclease [Solirubrobacteraceae bacterium]|nr:putative endonuclease [Solirubrobacteraceae bacterium]